MYIYKFQPSNNLTNSSETSKHVSLLGDRAIMTVSQMYKWSILVFRPKIKGTLTTTFPTCMESLQGLNQPKITPYHNWYFLTSDILSMTVMLRCQHTSCSRPYAHHSCLIVVTIYTMDSVVKSCTQTKATTIALKTVETTTIKDLPPCPLFPPRPLFSTLFLAFFPSKDKFQSNKIEWGRDENIYCKII